MSRIMKYNFKLVFLSPIYIYALTPRYISSLLNYFSRIIIVFPRAFRKLFLNLKYYIQRSVPRCVVISPRRSFSPELFFFFSFFFRVRVSSSSLSLSLSLHFLFSFFYSLYYIPNFLSFWQHTRARAATISLFSFSSALALSHLYYSFCIAWTSLCFFYIILKIYSAVKLSDENLTCVKWFQR